MSVTTSKKFFYFVNNTEYPTQSTAIDAWKELSYREFWTAQGFSPAQVTALTNFCKDPVKGSALRQLLNTQPSFGQAPES